MRTVDPPELTASRPTTSQRRGSVLPVALVVAGLALAVLVGRDGEAGWRIAGSWPSLRPRGPRGASSVGPVRWDGAS